jgi:hypothetical protein
LRVAGEHFGRRGCDLKGPEDVGGWLRRFADQTER